MSKNIVISNDDDDILYVLYHPDNEYKLMFKYKNITETVNNKELYKYFKENKSITGIYFDRNIKKKNNNVVFHFFNNEYEKVKFNNNDEIEYDNFSIFGLLYSKTTFFKNVFSVKVDSFWL